MDNVEQRRVVLILVTKALELLKSLPVRSRAGDPLVDDAQKVLATICIISTTALVMAGKKR